LVLVLVVEAWQEGMAAVGVQGLELVLSGGVLILDSVVKVHGHSLLLAGKDVEVLANKIVAAVSLHHRILKMLQGGEP